jgi:dockerin type I repeat protein
VKEATILVVAILLVATLTSSGNIRTARAWGATNPGNFTIIADIEGWNLTNPTVTEFRAVGFKAIVNWGDCCTHDFAYYTNGFSPGSVNTSDICNVDNTIGCLARTAANVSATYCAATSPAECSSLVYSPSVPANDFSGLGGYEFFCQFHPSTMHGHIQVYKDPDLDNNGSVSIVDVANVAFAFGATPTSPNWNAAADLNNDGVVNILDVAFDAFYFGAPI